jgi:3-deoxy-manno-octulosonate cytidylyltransferase (CMP-KDO synthetase)
VATDDSRIADTVKAFGGQVVMTRGKHETGTDRVAEVARSLEYEYVVNLQGDEPVFDPQMVEAMMDRLVESPSADIVTACHPMTSNADHLDPNIVKVVVDRDHRALYFSRCPIPYGALEKTDGDDPPRGVYRHVGVYAFSNDALQRFTGLPRGDLEKHERLEQLRALENGMNIDLVVTSKPTMGVDVPGDIKKVEKEIAKTYTN